MIHNIIEWIYNSINWQVYTPLEIVLLGLGFISWFAAYYYIIQDARTFKYCEMPMLVATGNIAWEFSYTFLLPNNLSVLFTIGAGLWFARDIFINAYVWRYWKNDVTNPWIGRTYHWWYIFSLISWFGIVYLMRTCGFDNDLGVVSALIINVAMSALYIYQLVSFPEFRGKGMSYKAAWLKMFGTGIISVASVFIWPTNHYLQVLCLVTWLLDMFYIYLFKNYQPDPTWLARKRN